jgi:tripartite-type tricarboxylate transporter receptor subunit TctC
MPIVNRLVSDMQKTIESPDIKNRLLGDGAEPAAGTARQFQDFLVSEMTHAREIILRAGVQP